MVLILDEPLLESMLKSVLRGTSKASHGRSAGLGDQEVMNYQRGKTRRYLHLEGAFTPYLQYRIFLMMTSPSLSTVS